MPNIRVKTVMRLRPYWVVHVPVTPVYDRKPKIICHFQSRVSPFRGCSLQESTEPPTPCQLKTIYLNRVLASYHGMRARFVNVAVNINMFRPTADEVPRATCLLSSFTSQFSFSAQCPRAIGTQRVSTVGE